MSVFYKLNRVKQSDLYDDDEKIGIQIVYYHNKKRVSFSTNLVVKTKDWDKNWRDKRNNEPILPTDRNHKEKNLILQQKWKELKDVLFEIKKNDMIPNVDIVKSYMRRVVVQKITNTSSEIHFEIYLQKYFEWIKSDEYLVETRNTPSYVRSLVGSVKDILNFSLEYQYKNNIKLLPSDIDKSFTNGLITYCDKRGLQPSTIKKRIKVLVMFSRWLEENYNIKFIVRKPKRDNDKKNDILWLKDEEITQIWKYKEFEFENPNHPSIFKENKKDIELFHFTSSEKKGSKLFSYTNLEVYKDLLLFLCGSGLRFVDSVNLRLSNFKPLEKRKKGVKKGSFIKGEFVLTPQKTNDTVRIPNTPLLWEIYKKYSTNREIDDYLFPRTKKDNPISNQKFNKQIKEVCRIIGLNRRVTKPKWDWNNQLISGTEKTKFLWEEITSHIGRRTMIRTYIDVGYDRRTLMSITGHKNYKTLDVYYESTERDRFKYNDLLHNNLIKEELEIQHLDEKDRLFQMYKNGELSWEQLGKLLND